MEKNIKYIWYQVTFSNVDNIDEVAKEVGSKIKRDRRIKGGLTSEDFINDTTTVIIYEYMSKGRYEYLKRYKNKKK